MSTKKKTIAFRVLPKDKKEIATLVKKRLVKKGYRLYKTKK